MRKYRVNRFSLLPEQKLRVCEGVGCEASLMLLWVDFCGAGEPIEGATAWLFRWVVYITTKEQFGAMVF